jgi:AcrR family transcriptional regulator
MKRSTEDRILEVAAEILEQVGPEGLTTRAVCAAAKVTAPTLYHHFGDKAGLLNALLSSGIADFMAHKRLNLMTDDPLADLRRGWDGWIEFALARPRLFGLMVEQSIKQPELAREALANMHRDVSRLHAGKRLRRGINADAAALAVQAAANGVIALLQGGASTQQVKSTGSLLFEAVLGRVLAN